MKHTLKSVRALAATLITFGSLAGGVNAAITVTGDPGVSATVQVTNSIFWTITSSGSVQLVALDEAMSSPDGGQTEPTMSATILLTNITTGLSVNLTDFGDGNIVFGDLTAGDSYFWTGGSNLAVTVGDIVRLSSSSPISFVESGFDPDWNGFSFVGDTFLLDESGIAKTALTTIPEPSSVLLLGFGTMGLLARRRNIK